MTIRNPVEWSLDHAARLTRAIGAATEAIYHDEETANVVPQVRRIELVDLRDALARGFADFAAYRTDVIFLCIIYPIVGIVLARAAVTANMLPMLFPLASGFALLGPVAAIGLYEMSRQREKGVIVNWAQAFGVLQSPSFAAIAALAGILLVLFGGWLFAAQAIYDMTLGPVPPASTETFIAAVFGTGAGWNMIAIGVAVGFCFALIVLSITVVSFPMLIDRRVRVDTAIWTSVRVVRTSPLTVAAWGIIVSGALVLGSLPMFVGLAIVLPVLGHATWHLYRRAVPR